MLLLEWLLKMLLFVYATIWEWSLLTISWEKTRFICFHIVAVVDGIFFNKSLFTVTSCYKISYVSSVALFFWQNLMMNLWLFHF